MRTVVWGLVACASLAACFTKPDPPAGPGDDTPGNGWLDGWQFRKRVEIHPGIAGMLAEFPIAVMRTDDLDLEAHASSNGHDIVATRDDGETELPVELVRFGSKNLELWVRIPELADGSAFYLYYGGPNIPESTATWDGPFAGVWHLSDGGNAADSTTHRTNLAAADPDTTPGIEPAGKFGRARQFDGNDQFGGGGASNPADGSLDFGTGSFSYSLWVQQTGVLGQYDTPFYKGGGSPLEVGYCWLLGTDGGWTAKLHDGTTAAFVELGPPADFANRWVHLAAVVDRTAQTLTAYADGVAVTGTSITALGTVSTDFGLRFGLGTIDNPFQGMIDEVRIYSTAIEPDWVRAEFENATNPEFLAVGPEEQRP